MNNNKMKVTFRVESKYFGNDEFNKYFSTEKEFEEILKEQESHYNALPLQAKMEMTVTATVIHEGEAVFFKQIV